jgi:hypothetical protein
MIFINLLIEFLLLLLSPDTEPLSAFADAMILCVLESLFSFSTSDRNGRFGVSYEKIIKLELKDFIGINMNKRLTSSVNSNNGVFVELVIVDVDGAGLAHVIEFKLSLLSLSADDCAMGLNILEIDDMEFV